MVGTALIGLLRVLGPRRTLERTTRNIRSANNYTEATLEAVAPNHYRVRVNYVVRPGFYAGIIEQCCRAGGAKDELEAAALGPALKRWVDGLLRTQAR